MTTLTLSKEAEDVLIALARRHHPQINYWWGATYQPDVDRCYICNIHTDSIITHGLKHLREANLLPFI